LACKLKASELEATKARFLSKLTHKLDSTL
jgi:hypothetical protein